MFRGIVAFLVPPAAPLFVVSVMQVFIESTILEGAATASLLLAYPSALVFGIPLYFFAKEGGWTKWWHFVLQFALLGAAIPLIIMTLIFAGGSSAGVGTGTWGPMLLKHSTAMGWFEILVVGLLLGAIS